MGTYDVRDWLESLNIANCCFSGRIDNTLEKILCVFDDRMDKSNTDESFGGDEYNKIHEFKATVLFQWDKDPENTEKAAKAFIKKLKEYRAGGFMIGDYLVNYLRVANASEDCDRNGNGLCQRIIHFDVIYSD